MSLLYFGLSLSVVGLVGGQTSQASQPFWGEEKLGREEEKVGRGEEREERFHHHLQPSLNATSVSSDEEPWPLKECIAILGDQSTTFVAVSTRADHSAELLLYIDCFRLGLAITEIAMQIFYDLGAYRLYDSGTHMDLIRSSRDVGHSNVVAADAQQKSQLPLMKVGGRELSGGKGSRF